MPFASPRGGGRGAGGRGGGRTFASVSGSHACLSFNRCDVYEQESTNVSRESVVLPTLQPPPVFPKPLFPCLPIRQDSEQETLLEIKKELLSAFRSSRFTEDLNQTERPIQRYSDRYSHVAGEKNADDWDMRLFPTELHEKRVKVKKKKQRAKKVEEGTGDVLDKLPADETEADKTSDNSDDDAAEGREEEVPEEVGEEETDYAQTYFDNGEDYLEPEHDDDGDEGPTY